MFITIYIVLATSLIKVSIYLGSSTAGTVIGVLFFLLLLLIGSLYGILVCIRIHHNKTCTVECKVPFHKLKYDLKFREKEYILLDLEQGGKNEKYFSCFDKCLANNGNNTNGNDDNESCLLSQEGQSKVNSRANLPSAKAKVSVE